MVETNTGIEIEVLTTHLKCRRCYRYVSELFPYDEVRLPICRRCCIVMWDMDHGFVGTDYADGDNQ